MFQISDEEVSEFIYLLVLWFVLEKLFLISNDKYLVVLIVYEYYELWVEYEILIICIFFMGEEMKVFYFIFDSFCDLILIEIIVDMQLCLDNFYMIVVMYKLKEMVDYNDNSLFGGFGGGVRYGFMIFDICSGLVVMICDLFLVLSFQLKCKLFFDISYFFCFDDELNIFDICEGCYVG